MKAAVIYQAGSMPQYTEIAEPVVHQENNVLVKVRAVAIKHLDRAIASGKHYSSGQASGAKIAGGDGIGVLPDGQRIYGIGVGGTMAEQAIFLKSWSTPVPDGLDDITAAALPNAVMGSAMALLFRAQLQRGETVLINGATGFTGKMAVQLARHYGAGKIIVTGRNQEILRSLIELGADQLIPLKENDEAIISQLKEIHAVTPIHVIIDYLWGHSAQLILSALKGGGTFSPRTRYVSIGAMSGDIIQLSSQILRSIDLRLSGSGLGSWTKDEVNLLFHEILPEIFQLAAAGKLKIEVITVALKDIEQLWETDPGNGKRLVVSI